MIHSRVVVLVWSAICLAASIGVIGCESPIEPEPDLQSPEKTLGAVRLNYNAVNLTKTGPNNTIQLEVDAWNLAGERIPNVPTATFIAADTSILVFPDGTVRARGEQRSASGTRVIASLTYNGVTRADTGFATVTETMTPPTLKTFSLQVASGDSARMPARGYNTLAANNRMFIATVLDVDGDPIPRSIVSYRISDSKIATVNRQTGVVSAVRAGRVTLYATAMIYGVFMQDSLHIDITEPLDVAVRLDVGISGFVAPLRPVLNSTFIIAPGGLVKWQNAGPDSVDIVFDQPEAALKGQGPSRDSTWADTSGNIAPFAAVPGATSAINNQNTNRVRTFVTPGTYQWHSNRHPTLQGTIIVR